MSLWGVVFYCVATVSVIEVQLWRLPQYIHVQRDYSGSVECVIEKVDESQITAPP